MIRGLRWAVVAVLVLVVLAGCGSSGPDRSRLVAQVRAEIVRSRTPPALVPCVVQQARGLSTARLRGLATAGATLSPAQRALALDLLAACLRKGVGVATLHAALVQSLVSKLGPDAPAAVIDCFTAQAESVNGNQLAAVETNLSAAYRLGVQLEERCLLQPTEFAAFRSHFLTQVMTALGAANLPPAFQRCILGKARTLTPAVLAPLFMAGASGPAAEQARIRALGAQWGRECVAAGIRP